MGWLLDSASVSQSSLYPVKVRALNKQGEKYLLLIFGRLQIKEWL